MINKKPIALRPPLPILCLSGSSLVVFLHGSYNGFIIQLLSGALTKGTYYSLYTFYLFLLIHSLHSLLYLQVILCLQHEE